MEEQNNKFIVLEGIDGCGKSTQVELLANQFKHEGHKVYTTFEPTDSPIGSLIRNIMKGRIDADHKTIAGLFLADRLDHLQNKTNGILKKLEEGFTVISDRYYFSSYAYHSVHMPLDWVIQANSLCAELLRPDLNIYIDIDPEASMNRMSSARDNQELYETHEMLKNVRENYFRAFEKLKDEENIFQTDGNRSVEEIADEVRQKIRAIGI